MAYLLDPNNISEDIERQLGLLDDINQLIHRDASLGCLDEASDRMLDFIKGITFQYGNLLAARENLRASEFTFEKKNVEFVLNERQLSAKSRKGFMKAIEDLEMPEYEYEQEDIGEDIDEDDTSEDSNGDPI